STWKIYPVSARKRSYFEPQERRVLLSTVDIAVAGITRHDSTRHHDLDRPAEGIIDHRDRVGSHPVKRRDLLRGERLRLRRTLIIRIVAKDDVERDPTRAGILAAYDFRKILQLHGLSAVDETIRGSVSVNCMRLTDEGNFWLRPRR